MLVLPTQLKGGHAVPTLLTNILRTTGRTCAFFAALTTALILLPFSLVVWWYRRVP